MLPNRVRNLDAMSLDLSRNYTTSALRVGDADPYPQRRIGEFIGTVVANDWVNEEYKHLILHVHERALGAYAGQAFHLLCPSPDGAEVWMRRPMSIYRIDRAKAQLDFLYKVTGRGTRGMAMLAPATTSISPVRSASGFRSNRNGRTSSSWAAASVWRHWRRYRS